LRQLVSLLSHYQKQYVMKALLFLFPLFIACNSGNSQRDASKDSADAMKESMDNIDNSSVSFVTDVGNGNLTEIELGKLAQQNANYPRIKEFAAKMVDAHTKAMDKLQKASFNSGVTVPQASTDTSTISSFAEKKGRAFDNDYIKEMVSAHQKMADMLDAARSKLKDSSLKAFAEAMLPEVNAHLEEARNILEDTRKQKENRPEQGPDVSH
jgi:putative membrane protein